VEQESGIAVDDAAVSYAASTERLQYRLHLRMGEETKPATQAIIEVECNMPHEYAAHTCTIHFRTSIAPREKFSHVAASLRFAPLCLSYPSHSHPSLYLRSSSPLFDSECARRCNDALQQWLHSSEREFGDPLVLAAVEWIRERMEEWLVESYRRQQARPSAGGSSSSSSSASLPVFQREFILFHHMYSRMKRRAINEAAAEFQLTGVVKCGKPGIVIIEGDADHVQSWLTRIRGLSWQKMSSKHTERIPFTDAASSASTSAPPPTISHSSCTAFLRSHSKFEQFLELKPLPGAQWVSMAQLMEVVTPRHLDSAIREMIGLTNAEDDAAVDCDSEDDDGPAATAASSATSAVTACAPRKLDKRSLKDEQKRLAKELAQMNLAKDAVALKSMTTAHPKSNSSSSKHKASNASSISASSTSAVSDPSFRMVSDLPCVEVIADHAGGSSTATVIGFQSIKLHVTVRPNAAETEIIDLGSAGESVHIRLHAAPREGQANKEVVRYVREILQLNSNQVELLSGEKSREKVLLLQQVRSGEICVQLRALCQAATT
jgi:uncharacterized protein (TIGR00251 family)